MAGDEEELSEGLEVSRILITRRLTVDDDVVDVETSGDVRYIEALGMLRMAEQILDRRHGDDDE